MISALCRVDLITKNDKNRRVSDEIKSGGTLIGTSLIKALTYVDDIDTVNTLTSNVYYSHKRVEWFSDNKRLGLF